MKIWKFPVMLMLIQKCLENFAFLILRVFKLFTREVCKFLKKWANFYLILLFLNVCKQTFHISHVHISQKVKGVLMWNLWHIIFIWRPRYWQIFKSALVWKILKPWMSRSNHFKSYIYQVWPCFREI